MEDYEGSSVSPTHHEEDFNNINVRKGPWTEEEDAILINYVSLHGEARWNNIARSSGLRRTGKSCRLRWLNYLRPDVRRGNITLQEQFLILKLHSVWGNRWSKIAQYLPGRTDNEIKNYWRTRVQKQAKQLKCDVNSKVFKDTMRNVWMPRLLERIQAQSSAFTCQPEEMAKTDAGQPEYPNEPGSYQFKPNQYMVAELSCSMACSNSPETQVSTFSDPDGGSGMDPGNSCFEEFNGWGYGGEWMETMWKEEDYDSFWLLQDQISYSYDN